MKYQEMLELCRSNNVDAAQCYIAQEMQFQLDDVYEVKYTAERFEQLCWRVCEAYLKGENNNMWAICKAVAGFEKEYIEGNKDKDPIKMSIWEILEEAGWMI